MHHALCAVSLNGIGTDSGNEPKCHPLSLWILLKFQTFNPNNCALARKCQPKNCVETSTQYLPNLKTQWQCWLSCWCWYWYFISMPNTAHAFYRVEGDVVYSSTRTRILCTVQQQMSVKLIMLSFDFIFLADVNAMKSLHSCFTLCAYTSVCLHFIYQIELDLKL